MIKAKQQVVARLNAQLAAYGKKKKKGAALYSDGFGEAPGSQAIDLKNGNTMYIDDTSVDIVFENNDSKSKDASHFNDAVKIVAPKSAKVQNGYLSLTAPSRLGAKVVFKKLLKDFDPFSKYDQKCIDDVKEAITKL